MSSERPRHVVFENQSRRVRPEDILTPAQAETLQKADQGLLPCPWCGKPLQGAMIVWPVYEGVLLVCEDSEGCGFHEF